MRVLTNIFLIGALCSSLSVYATSDMGQLKKDVKILTTILDTSLGETSDEVARRYRGVDGVYIKGQGLVFTLDTRARRPFMLDFDWAGLEDLQDVDMPTPPTPGNNWEVHSDEWQEFTRQAVRLARRALGESRDRLREVREQKRELNWERRQLDRELKDLEFEQRHADKPRSKEIAAELERLRKERANLEARANRLDSEIKQMEARRQASLAKKRAAHQQQIKGFLAAFEQTVADTLCRYGAGVRNLAKGESVSFVIANFSMTPDKHDEAHRIYVFSREQVGRCVNGDITTEALLSGVDSYQF